MGDKMMPHLGNTVSSLTSAWNAAGLRMHRKIMMHMHFYWSHKTEFLFPGWPGSDSPGMYALGLIFVVALAILVEYINYCSIIKPGTGKVAAGFFQTGLHAVRSGLSYMVMLAVMSYNGGVFLAAVGGHAVGFLLFGSRAFKKSGGSGSEKTPDLPPTKV